MTTQISANLGLDISSPMISEFQFLHLLNKDTYMTLAILRRIKENPRHENG